MNRKRRPYVCRANGCSSPPFLGGLCAQHHHDDFRRRERRRKAIDTLHTGVIDGELFSDIALRNELFQLREWWVEVCDAVNFRRCGRRLPLDEAEYAANWCISLAEALIDAELAKRAGTAVPMTLDATRHWVWDRFRTVAAGLSSNGLPRNQ